MKFTTLNDLLAEHLRDLYHMENQLVKALPKMAKAASSSELKNSFEEHLEQTKHQAERLERIFEKLDLRGRGTRCEGMEGIIEEGKNFLSEDAEPDVRDAGLIAVAQRVEHYEMAGYGCARSWAEQLGLHDVAELLGQSLDEEKVTDEKLTRLAEEAINQEATAGIGHTAAGSETAKRSRARRR